MNQPDDGRGNAPVDRTTIRPADGPPRAASVQTAAVDPPPRRRGGSGFLAGLIGGLLGTAAVLAAAGWYAFERGPVRPALQRLTTAEEAAREAESGIAELGGQVQQLRGTVEAGTGSVGQVEQRISALEGRVAGNEQAVRALTGTLEQANASFRAASDEVIGRLEEVNARLAEVARGQPADIVDKGTVEDISRRQASVEQAQSRLEGSVARVEQLVAQGLEAGNQQAEALQRVVEDSRNRVDQMAAVVGGLSGVPALLARQEEVDAAQTRALEAAGQQLAAVRSDVDQRLEEAVGRLSELDRQRERGVGMSLAVDSLETALQTGQPYQPTLDVLGQLAQGDGVVADTAGKLQPTAAEGVATVAELARQLAEIERSLGGQQGSQPQDWLARTRENLTGLVDVHPAGQEAVPGLSAVQAARQAVLLQDLEGAVQALEPLAQSGNQQASSWVAAAKARLDARAAIETLRQHVKTLLARQD